MTTPVLETQSTKKATTPRLIAKVREQGYLNFIEWAPADDGHLESVHIAEFRHPQFGACEAFAKLYKGGTGHGIVNEITGWLCAHAMGVPQPEFAFVANIPLARLRSPTGWVAQEKRRGAATLPAFCTKRLDGKSAAIRMPNSEIPALLDDVRAWKDVARATALDEHIAHTDRHLNNLIRLGRRQYAVIDNGRLASDTTASWSAGTLDSGRLYWNRLSERLWNNSPDDATVSCILDAAANHAGAFENVRDELHYWWELLLPTREYQDFSSFLERRTDIIEALLRKRYHRLA